MFARDPPPTLVNFLAHLYLAEDNDESLVGNLLGDFVKGLPSKMKGKLPSAVIRGIRQHRAIDFFTDQHPLFLEAKNLLSPERKRLAGIIIDVFYDYFLSSRWPGGQQARRNFIENSHAVLLANQAWLPENFRSVLPQMISEKWLESYASVEGMALTFRRVSTRSPAAALLVGAEEDFLSNQKAFEQLYLEFFPELETFSRDWLEQN